MILIHNFFSLIQIQFQECQNLLEENRRLTIGNGPSKDNVDDILMTSSTNGGSVEETVLQTQIETLQWQLNQVNPFIATLMEMRMIIYYLPLTLATYQKKKMRACVQIICLRKCSQYVCD